MTSIEIENIIETLSDPIFGYDYISKENALVVINVLRDSNIKIFGFDGFKINKMSRQIEQNYCRDYSQFSQFEQYHLCIEYFQKDESFNTLYHLSFDGRTR